MDTFVKNKIEERNLQEFLDKFKSSLDYDDAPQIAKNTVVLKIILFATITVESLFYYIPGPTLLDLIERVYEPVMNVTLFYCARAVGSIIGLSAGSFIFQWLLQSNHKSLLMFLTMLILATTCILLAITVAFDIMLILFSLSGLATGILITGINAICLHSWIHTSTFFCILSCFYGLGAFMSPVLARYFVNKSINITSEDIDVPLRNYTEIHKQEMYKNLRIGYWTSVSNIYIIIGVLFFIVALLWLIYYAFAMTQSEITEPVWIEKSNVIAWNLIILNASLMTFASEAIAFGYPQILPSYMIINYKTNQIESLDYIMVFLGFFLIGRVAASFLATDYLCGTPPKVMLAVSIILIFGGVIVLYLDSTYTYTTFLIAQGFLGAGVSPIFINIYLWLCCKIYITHRSMNPMFIMRAISELIFPWLLGKYGWPNPGNIKHFVVIVACIITLLYLIQYCFLVRVRRESCPGCEQEAASAAVQLPILQRIDATIMPSQSVSSRNQTTPEMEPRGVTSFRFVDSRGVFDHVSELQQRVQRGNTLAKSAIKDLEYSVKH